MSDINITDAGPYDPYCKDVVIKFEVTDPSRIYNMALSLENIFRLYTPDGRRVPIWFYDVGTGIWLDRGEELMREIISRSMGKHYSGHTSNMVIKKIKDDTRNPTVRLGEMVSSRIVMRNGVYDLDTNEFTPEFDSDEYQIIALSYDYDPKAKCPRFKQALKEWHPNNKDAQKALVEWMGYCLVHHYLIHLLLFLIGDGENGKTKYLNILIALLGGRRNVTAITIQQLAGDRFMTARLYGKLANVCAEIPDDGIKNTEKLKSLSGGDALQAAQFKMRDGFEFENFAKLTFAGYKIPASPDRSDGWFRRWYLIEFNEQFLLGDPRRDPDLGEKLEAELSGIFNLAVAGYRRMMKQGHLTGDKGTEEKRRDVTRRSDPLQYFIEVFCKPDLEGRVTVEAAHALYKKVAFKYGKKPPKGKIALGNRMPEHVDVGITMKIRKKSVKCYAGIMIDLDAYHKEIGKPRENIARLPEFDYPVIAIIEEERDEYQQPLEGVDMK